MIQSFETEKWVEIFGKDYIEYFNEFSPVCEEAFPFVLTSSEHGIRERMILEYRLPNNSFWLAIVKKVFGPLLELKLLGSPEEAVNSNLLVDCSSKSGCLFPIGYCQSNKRELEAPKEIQKSLPNWRQIALDILEDVSYDTIPMFYIQASFDGKTTPISRILNKTRLYLRSQEEDSCWPVVILNNFLGVLKLRYEVPYGITVNQKNSYFLLHYSSWRLSVKPSTKLRPPPFLQLSSSSSSSSSLISTLYSSNCILQLQPKDSPPIDLFSSHIPQNPFKVLEKVQMIDPITESSFKTGLILWNQKDEGLYGLQFENQIRIFHGGDQSVLSYEKEIQVPQNFHFQKHQILEVLTAQNIFVVSLIIDIQFPLLLLAINGLQKIYIPYDSPRLFPLGWSLHAQVPIFIPLELVHRKTALRQTSSSSSSLLCVSETPFRNSSWIPCIYINYKCYSASFLTKKRVESLPKFIGPGSVRLIARQIINYLLGFSFKSISVLKALKMSETSNKKIPRDFVVEEFKGKSKVLFCKGKILIPTKAGNMEDFIRSISFKLGACPYLISFISLGDSPCPEDCLSRMVGSTKKKNNLYSIPNLPSPHSSSSSSSSSFSPEEYNTEMDLNSVLRRSLDCKSQEISHYSFSPKRNSSSNQTLSSNQTTTLYQTPPSSSSSSNQTPPSSRNQTSPPPIRVLRLRSNPKNWSSLETAKFLAQTKDCSHLAEYMRIDEIDGSAFLLLNYPTVKDYWSLSTGSAIQLCQHVESVKLAYSVDFAP